MESRLFLALMMAFLLPLAACSDDEGDDDTTGSADDDDATADDDDDDTTAGDDDDTTAGDDDDDDDTTAGDDDDSSTGDDDDTTAGDDDDTTAAVAEIDHTIPADAATVMCIEANIVVQFTAAVTSATVDLVDEGGNVIPGDNTLSNGDTTLTFDPYGTDPDQLGVDAAYTATIDWDGLYTYELNFRTSPGGPPLTNPETAVEGRDYLLDLAGATVTEPATIGALLQSYLGDIELAVQVTDIDVAGGTLEAFGATLASGIQDLCVPVVGLTDDQLGAWCNPFMEVGPTTLTVDVTGNPTDVQDTRINGTVVQEGARMVSGRLAGELDTRGLDPLVGGGLGATCALMASLGIACEPCPDGSGTYCISLVMEDIQAQPTPVTGTNPETGDVYTTLTEIDAAQVTTWIAGGYCP
jgi:hypothetical protein